MKKKILNKLFFILFIIGIVLLLINSLKWFIPLKNPAIYQHKTGFKDDITLTTQEALDIIDQPIIDEKKYVEQVTFAINKGVMHYCDDKFKKIYNLEIPLQENYLLYIFHHLTRPKEQLPYAFCDYKKTLERGVGCCGQVSIALANLLNGKKIHTNVIAYPEHVITEVTFSDNTKWIVDPDYGVITKYSIDEITKNPKLIHSFYLQKGFSLEIIINLQKIFKNASNRKIYPNTMYNPPFSSPFCNGNHLLIERAFYILKWLIPMLLVFPLVAQKLYEKYLKTKNHEK